MKDTELNWIRERCEKATPGPWVWLDRGQIVSPSPNAAVEDYKVIIEADLNYYQPKKEDTAFISAARTDLPKLLDEIQRLREALKFYADPMTYVDPYYIDNRKEGQPSILSEGGKRAREALGEK